MSDSADLGPADLGTAQAARRIAAGDLTSEALVTACLARISARDGAVQAWTFLDPDLALAQARAADARQAEGQPIGPLHGVPIGIKDIIDTADMPTENGFGGHKGRQPTEDAACVRALRDAGAVIMGKTVTTELANRVAGKTRNPVNPAHTPGGSSSGSAAAVRAGMVPGALGTQTGGSVIRPASYCGIHALKPSFGLISRVGIMPQSDPLDTIGTYGRSIEDVAYLADALTGPDLRDSAPRDPDCNHRGRPALHRAAMAAPPRRPHLAFIKTPVWGRGDPRMHAALEALAASLGTDCEEIALPEGLDQAWGWHRTAQLYGMARYYGPLSDQYGPLMSPRLTQHVAEGREIHSDAYRAALSNRQPARDALAPIFAHFDAILTPSSPGPAPEGHLSTGEAIFNAFWTYVGMPCVNLPLLEVDGLPMGVQLVGQKGTDGALLRTARWLEGIVA